MTFEDVLADIEELVGKRIDSITGKTGLTINSIDRNKKQIWLINVQGKLMSRPFSHIRRVWEALCENLVVDVENDVFKGSGSSRNQPETILANLPYIEWLELNKLKHLVYVRSRTHELGTLKQTDAIEVETLKERLQEEQLKFPTAVVVAGDISLASRNLEKATGLPVKSLEAGVYVQVREGIKILLVTSSLLPPAVKPGTYLVIRSDAVSVPQNSHPIHVADQEFHVFTGGGMNLFMYIIG